MKLIPTHQVHRDHLQNKMAKIPIDGSWCVEIKKVTKKRSINQNSMYWAWMTIIAEEYGAPSDKNYYHNYFKKEFLPIVSKEMFGRNLRCYKETSSLSVEEFTEYLDKIERFVMGMGLELPKVLGKQYDQMMEVYG